MLVLQIVRNLPLIGASRAEMLASIGFLAFVRLRSRYVGSLIGLGWSLLNPLSQIAIFSFVFSAVMKVPIDKYPLYLMSALLPWSFMSSSVMAAASSFVSRKHEFNHSLVSPILFAVSDIAVELLAFVIAYGVLLAVALAFFGVSLDMLALLPLVLLPLVVATFGAGIISAYLGALFADFSHILSIVLGIVFWLSPIVYHWTNAPEAVQPLIKYNPVSLLISPPQILLHGGYLPSIELLLANSLIALVVIWLAIRLHRRYFRTIIFYL